MKKNINPEVRAIQKRFIEALNTAVRLGVYTGISDFCERHNFNRIKYSRIRNSVDKPTDEMLYKTIDIDALSALCLDFNVSAEWLLLGRGKMLKRQDNED